MGAKAGGGSEFNSEPNVIPLTDILLVLLIIFMVITPILKGGVDVKLPEAKNVKPEPSKGVVTISVKKDGTVFHFCSSKCEKAQIKRGFKNRITPWTNLFNALKKNKK
jgi:biopolymer transport protein ExbD